MADTTSSSPPPTDLNFMYLMCSRFCHDMATPLGAISIGVDMLPGEEEAEGPGKILKISVHDAMYRLEIMRCLCGFGAYADRPTLGEMRNVVDKAVDPEKFSLIWPEEKNHPFYGKVVGDGVRLYLSLFMVLLDAMPRGGELKLNKDFSISVKGSFVKIHENNLRALKGELRQEEVDSRSIVPYFSYTLAKKLGVNIYLQFEKPNEVRIVLE